MNARCDKKLVRPTAIVLSIDKNRSGCQISKIRISDDSRYHPTRRRLTPSSLIRSTRAGERLMKAAGTYSLVETRLVYDGNVNR